MSFGHRMHCQLTKYLLSIYLFTAKDGYILKLKDIQINSLWMLARTSDIDRGVVAVRGQTNLCKILTRSPKC